MRRLRSRGIASLFLFAVVGWWSPLAARAEDQPTAERPATGAPIDASTIVVRMAREGAQYDPRPLRDAGAPGLAALLDHVLPWSREDDAPLPGADLIAALDHADPSVREKTTRTLIDVGPAYHAAVEEAAGSAAESPEIRERCRRVLSAWEAAAQRRADGRAPASAKCDGGITAAFRAYRESLDCKTEPAVAKLLASRALRTLKHGMPEGQSREVVVELLRGVARTKNERLLDSFAPLLAHDEVAVAVLVTKILGEPFEGNNYYPPFLFHGLASDRLEVVAAAMDAGPAPVWDVQRLPRLHAALRRIFDGDNDALKFKASFTLMHGFGERAAVQYLLTQVDSVDRSRATRALAWIGDTCNIGRPAWPALLDAVSPLLESSDPIIRRSAVHALSPYVGESPVSLLVRMIDDPDRAVAGETAMALESHRDQSTVRRLLSAAARSDNAETRHRASKLLEKLRT